MSAKRNILLLSYYFPPMGMGGVGRASALFKYLPVFNYNLYVITVKKILYPEYDYSLLSIKDEKKIYRTGSVDPARLLYLFGLRNQSQSVFPVLSKRLPFYFPDLKRGWNIFACRMAEKIIRTKKISAIITTSPAPSTHIMGLKLKAKTNTTWIADFRDYWFSMPIEKIYPAGIMRNYSLNLKKEIIERADEVVSVNNDIKKYLGRGQVIMNAADNDAAKVWQITEQEKSNKFIIGAMGTYNYLVPIEPLFQAVRKLVDLNGEYGNKISIIHVGHYHEEMQNLVDKYGLNDTVCFKGYLNRKDAIAVLSDADILYLSVRSFNNYSPLPGRIFDYLVSGKPILGVVPPDTDAENLLKKYPYGYTTDGGNLDELISLLEKLFNEKKHGISQDRLDQSRIEKYTSRTLAHKYADLLDHLL